MSDVPNTMLRYVAFGVIEIVRVSAASSRPLGGRRWCGRSRSSERRSGSSHRLRNDRTLSAGLGIDTGVSERLLGWSLWGRRWGGTWGRTRDRLRDRLRSGLRLLIQIVVQSEIGRWRRAVNVRPPIAHEVTLVENGAHGAKERVLFTVSLANVEHLATGFNISVISGSLSFAVKCGLGNGCECGIVRLGFTRNRVL